LSDLRVWTIDTDDFPPFVANLNPDSMRNLFMGIGHDNVNFVTSLRASLTSMQTLDSLISSVKQQQLRPLPPPPLLGGGMIPLSSLPPMPAGLFAP
jgi:hypothetical protein